MPPERLAEGGLLHGIHTARSYAVAVGVHSALTAALAEEAGFDAVWVSGLEISTAMFLPDANVITFTEVSATVRDVRRATDLPIVVDADNGYGSDEVAMRACEEFTAGGAAAICVEDNAFPKRNSFYSGVARKLETSQNFARRIERVRGYVGDEVEIVARTEGLVAGLGPEATIERARSYLLAGADAIFVQADERHVRDFAAVLAALGPEAPIVTAPTAMAHLSASDLHSMGASLVIYSNAAIRMIVKTLRRSLPTLRAQEQLSYVDAEMAPLEDVLSLPRPRAWLAPPA